MGEARQVSTRVTAAILVTMVVTAPAAASAPDPAQPPAPRTMAVFLFNFKNDARQPLTVDEVRRRVFTAADSTAAFYREQSYGLVDLRGKVDPTGDVFGWTTIDAFNR